jgi:hypothetical protein
MPEPKKKRQNNLLAMAQGIPAALDNTIGGIIPGAIDLLTYAGGRAIGQNELQAKRNARYYTGLVDKPFGKAFGVTGTQGYQQEASQQLLQYIGANVNKGAKWLSRQTGLPVGDVENMIQTAMIAAPAGLNQARGIRRTAAPAAQPRNNMPPAPAPRAAAPPPARQLALPAPNRQLALPAPKQPATFAPDINPTHGVNRSSIVRGQSNYLVPLSDYTSNLFRETNLSSLQDFIPGSKTYTPQSFGNLELFLADSPDMALGQGGNKGVLMSFDSAGIKGKVNTGKPNWTVGFEEGLGSEFVARHNPISSFQNALKSFRIMNDAQIDPATLQQLQRTLPQLEQQGWTKVVGDGFIQYDAPAKGKK